MKRTASRWPRLSSSLLLILPVLALVAGTARAAQTTQLPLAGSAIPQFLQPLPVLDTPAALAEWPDAPGAPYPRIRTVDGTQPVTLSMCEFQTRMLPPGAVAPGAIANTYNWGYVVGEACPGAAVLRDTYVGPVVVAKRGTPTQVKYVNALGTSSTTNLVFYRFSTDQTLFWADPVNRVANACNLAADNLVVPLPGSACALNYGERAYGAVPAVPHLHGGEIPPELDGGPDAWFTSDGTYKGQGYYTRTVSTLPLLPSALFPLGTVVLNGADSLCYAVGTNLTVGDTWTRTACGPFAVYRYPNSQEAGPLWFHDHALGITRLNVYAGIAGAWFVTDPALPLPANLPGVDQVVPLVLQDRMFDTTGQLFFPGDTAANILWATNPEHPYWVPEFVGDTIVVNGKAWPFLKVQPKRYRVLFLNGANARTFELALLDAATGLAGPPLWVIGDDGGYLDAAVKIDPAVGGTLTIMPGERYEAIVDFAAFAGHNLVLRNTGRTPYPKGGPPQGATVGRVMQFQVAAGAVVDTSFNPAVTPAIRPAGATMTRLAAAGAALVPVQKVRQLTLNEVLLPKSVATDPVTGVPNTAYPGGPVEILVNNTKFNGDSPRPYADFVLKPLNGVPTWYSELPQEGDVEQWEFVNLTADAHPIHLHLVQAQILSRQGFNVSNYNGAYALAFPPVALAPTDPRYPAFKACIGGVYCPGFGPPLDYGKGAVRAGLPLLGGNPDVTRFLQGPVLLPKPEESGWKDTIVVMPGMVTRLLVRFAPTAAPAASLPAQLAFPFDPSDNAGYVWHCHILDHEDNEMMRPEIVLANPAVTPAARTYVKGVDY